MHHPIPDWTTYKPNQVAVTVYTRRDNDVLLIHKKRGLGAGKVNGPGGRIEEGETPEQAAIREVHEEVGLQVSDLEPRALLHFAFTNGLHLDVTAFIAQTYAGSLLETDEAIPFWCELEEVPYDRMWEDDRAWLPLIFRGYQVEGWFLFDDDAMLWSRVEASVLPPAES
jgi:8-oxo-dGTP diphosphatase